MSLYITQIFNALCSPPGMSFINEPLSAFIMKYFLMIMKCPLGIHFHGNNVLLFYYVALNSVQRKCFCLRLAVSKTSNLFDYFVTFTSLSLNGNKTG